MPPKYTADAKEVGSFDRYSRRVRLWAKRASGWMTDGDAALLLVESLSGAAERELEFTPLVEIENGGVEFVLQQLEASSKTSTWSTASTTTFDNGKLFDGRLARPCVPISTGSTSCTSN